MVDRVHITGCVGRPPPSIRSHFNMSILTVARKCFFFRRLSTGQKIVFVCLVAACLVLWLKPRGCVDITPSSVNAASSGGAAFINTASSKAASIHIEPTRLASINKGLIDDRIHGTKHGLPPGTSYLIPNIGKDWNGTYEPFYFFIYSAFYDDRPFRNTPKVNIFGLIKNTGLSDLSDLKLRCVLKYDTGTGTREKIVSASVYIAPSSDITKDRINVCTFLLQCSAGNGLIPTGVNVLMHNPNQTTIQLGSSVIEVMPKPDKKRPLGACVCALYAPDKPIFPHVRPFAIVQWMEMQKIMGVDHVTVYINAVSVSVLTVLEHYVATGYLTLRSIGPVDSDTYKQPRFTSIGDCMQRYMYSHHNVLVLDFDEVIMPREDISLPDLVQQYYKTHKGSRRVNFQFQNVMFFTDGPFQDASKPDYFYFLRTRHHQAPSPFPGPMKSIQDPSICPFGTNHRCLLDDNIVFINYTIAASHHYKACKATRGRPWNCRKEMRDLHADDIMLRYEDRLVPAVQRVINNLQQTYGQDFFD